MSLTSTRNGVRLREPEPREPGGKQLNFGFWEPEPREPTLFWPKTAIFGNMGTWELTAPGGQRSVKYHLSPWMRVQMIRKPSVSWNRCVVMRMCTVGKCLLQIWKSKSMQFSLKKVGVDDVCCFVVKFLHLRHLKMSLAVCVWVSNVVEAKFALLMRENEKKNISDHGKKVQNWTRDTSGESNALTRWAEQSFRTCKKI